MENPRGNCAPALPGMVWYGMVWYNAMVWYGMAWYGGVSLVWYGRYGAAVLPGEANHAHSIATAPREALLHLNILHCLQHLFLCSTVQQKNEPCFAATPTYEICCQSARPTRMHIAQPLNVQ